MIRALTLYVGAAEWLCRGVGRAAMWLLFLLMGVLIWGSLARATGASPIWTDETAQFVFMGYFFLGGAWSLQLGSAVRMDLLYTMWKPRTRALVDALTIVTLFVYLGVLLWGGIDSLAYSIEFGERRPGAWRPLMWPIKAIMVFGLVLMLLQCLAFLIRDTLHALGRPLPESDPT
jgi:TRAP-type mannitol/chloroaromatic compound transport system permease small subunit